MNELYYELVVETDDFYELIENFLGDWCEAVIEEDGRLITTYEHNPVDVLDAVNLARKRGNNHSRIWVFVHHLVKTDLNVVLAIFGHRASILTVG